MDITSGYNNNSNIIIMIIIIIYTYIHITTAMDLPNEGIMGI